MTGYGTARHQEATLRVVVEIRAVNNRYLKISTRCPDVYSGLEQRIDRVVRGSIFRGTVTVILHTRRDGAMGQCVIDDAALASYWDQLKQFAAKAKTDPPADLGTLLQLPGVVAEQADASVDADADWPVICRVIEEALANLQGFRTEEGRSMEVELQANCRQLAERLEHVAALAPTVVRDYRDRLHERVGELLKEQGAEVNSPDLIREVSIFADRCDINEEIIRLRSHLDQFNNFVSEDESQGRKLDFLSQEMFREVNTIGSKANNVEIAHCVVDMKAAVEKIREILQNVE